MKNWFFCFTLLALVTVSANAQITSAADGSWSSTTTWVGGAVPTATDNVVLQHNVTMAAGSCNDLTINAGGRLSGAAVTLNVNGNIDVNGGTIAVNSASIYLTCVSGKTLTVRNGAALTLTMPSTITGYANSFEYFFRGIQSADMVFDNTFIYTHKTSSTLATGAPIHALPNSQEYGDIIISCSSSGDRVISLASDITMAGNFSITEASSNSLTFNMSTYQIECTGTGKTVSLTAASGQKGPFTLNAAHAEPLKGFTGIDVSTNSGAFSMTVNFNGASAQQLGSSVTSAKFKNLTVNNAAGITFNQDVTVDGNLTVTAGTIATGSNTVTLGSSSVLTESSGNYIIGNLTASRTVGTGSSTFGGIGVSIDAGTDDLGTVTATRISGALGIVANPSNGAKTGIARKWSVSSDTPPSAGRNLTLSWLQDDDNGKDLTTAQLWKSTDNGISWSAIGSPADVSGSRSISVATTSFSDWTVSDASNVLPVELISFTARSENGTVELSWSTATEVNNAGFEIEKKAAGIWKSIGFVDGAGTSNISRTYSFVEKNVEAAIYAYRLKQVDRDGNYEYSHPVEVSVTGLPAALALNGNYPNPFNPSTTISFTVPFEGRAVVKVFDILGKEAAMVFNEVAQPGKQYSVPFVAASLPSGIYFSQLEFNGKSIVKKMVLMK